MGVRGAQRPRTLAGPAGAARPGVRTAARGRRAARRLRRLDAADRRADVPLRLQRGRELDALVRAAPPVRPADGALLRRELAPAVDELRALQRGVRRRARRGGRAERRGDGAGLSPVPRPEDAARPAAGRADRAVHAYALGDAGRLRGAARRRGARGHRGDARGRRPGLPHRALGHAVPQVRQGGGRAATPPARRSSRSAPIPTRCTSSAAGARSTARCGCWRR